MFFKLSCYRAKAKHAKSASRLLATETTMQNQEEIIDVQIHLAHLQRSVDELSELVLEQWKIISRQGNALEKLTAQIQMLEQGLIGPAIGAKPPHW